MATVETLTLDQFLTLEDTEPASEYVCGEAIQKPMPNESHGAIQLGLGAMILLILGRVHLGRVRSEWRCIFGPPDGERALVPDLVYASDETYRRGDLGSSGFLQTAPDLIVEVMSPGQSANRFAEQLQFYLRNGVRLVWVIDPRERVVTVYRPAADTLVLGAGDMLDGGDVLPGYRVAVNDILVQARDQPGCA